MSRPSKKDYDPLINSGGSQTKIVATSSATAATIGFSLFAGVLALGALITAAIIASGGTGFQGMVTDKLNLLAATTETTKQDAAATRSEIVDAQTCQPPIPRFPMETFVPEIDLTGKLFIVTGGARGQARRLCETLKKDRGAKVICTSRFAAGYPTAGQYELPVFRPETAPDVDYLEELDLDDDMSLTNFKTTVDGILTSLNRTTVDGLIMAAGRFCYGTIAGTTFGGPSAIARFMQCQEQDYRNVLRVLQVFFPLLPNTGYSRVITFGSLGGWSRFGPGFSQYNSYKWAARTLTDNFRFESFLVGNNAIRVSSVNPGSVRTTISVVNTTDPAEAYAIYTDITNVKDVWKFFQLSHTTPLGISPQEVANGVIQMLQLQEPPAETLIYPVSNNLFARGIFCGDEISKNDIWETNHGLLIHRFAKAFGYPDPAHTVGILEPYENATLPASSTEVWFFVTPDETNPNYDLEYKIGGNAWAGSGGWTHAAYVSEEVTTVGYDQYGYKQNIDFTPFAGSFTTLCAKAITLNGSPVTPFYPEFCIDIKVA